MDTFGSGAGSEPSPTNPKLDKAVENRDKLRTEYNAYHKECKNAVATKDAAKAQMEQQKAAMERMKQARNDAKKALKEAKALAGRASSSEEAARILGNANATLKNANAGYKRAVQDYNTSVKKFNECVSFCLKNNKTLVKMQKGLIKAEEKVAKLGGERVLPENFGTGWFKNRQFGLKEEKVLTGFKKCLPKLKAFGSAIGITALIVAGAVTMVDAAYAIFDDRYKFGDVWKEVGKDFGLTSKSSENSNVVENDAVQQEEAKQEAEAETETNEAVVEDEANAAVPEENTEVASQDEVQEIVDEQAVDKEIAADENEPIYEVKKGDNLWNICKKELKEKNGEDPTGAQIIARIGEVMDKNGLHWEEDHCHVMIYPKQKLKM